MKKISVVLAVYNEEKKLSNCLRSVQGLANEIVVVDGGSLDKTLEIAKKYNARIIHSDNPTIFHINKNKAINAAKFDWVLQLDADEIVTKELSQEIKGMLNKENDINGYWIPRRNFFLGKFLKKGGQYPDFTLRFYKRGKGSLPEKDVHEQAIVSGKVGYLKNDLLHIRDETFSSYIYRFNRYTSLLALQLKNKGVRINILTFIDFIILKPVFWFCKAYIRHRGYVDGFPGFIFALFSSLRFAIAYIKLYENSN